MDIQRDVRVAGQMPCCFLEGTENGIFYKSMVERWELQNVSALEAQLFYNLGLIHGKREERARRKKEITRIKERPSCEGRSFYTNFSKKVRDIIWQVEHGPARTKYSLVFILTPDPGEIWA